MTEYKVPYQFIAGTRARASQVNANFDYVAEGLKNLDDTKANISGDPSLNFSVAEPVNLQHAVTKRYVDLALAASGGNGGSGAGKSIFEVFHTLSTRTPAGAYSLRTGELILDAENTYASFWSTLIEQGSGIIPDFSNVSSLPEGYSSSFDNVSAIQGSESLDPLLLNRAFSPYSWVTVLSRPTSESPIVAELEFSELLTCTHFKINSHVLDTYDSIGEPSAKKAIKTASISVRQADGTWIPVAIINESKMPTANSRYYINEKPNLEFNAMRIVVADNFGSSSMDLSVYPVDPSKTTVRVVSEEQWQWEVERYKETGAFVVDTEEKTIRLPKINRLLSGVSDLWEVGIPAVTPAGGASIEYEDDEEALMIQEASDVSLNMVSTGLWIQVYNGLVESSLSNIRYIPHAQLFQEELFRFIPPEESGFYACDGSWRDGTYFTDAFTLLMNQYSQATAPSGAEYKLAPNGMRFATEAVYDSTRTKHGEVPYYVLDIENSRFKTPMSNNYIRCSSTIDNVGNILQDGVPNITGELFGTQENQSGIKKDPEGAFYRISKQSDGVDGTNGWFERIGFDASRSNAAYGRSDEVQVKSSYQILCVFLGNEVPQSSVVDLFGRIKHCESRMDDILQGQENVEDLIDAALKDFNTDVSSLEVIVDNNSRNLASLISEVNAHTDSISELRSDLDDVISRLSTLESKMLAAELRLSALETSQQNISFSVEDSTLNIEDS